VCLLAPLDREANELVWHPRGYPSRAQYMDTHRLSEHGHRAWAVDGAVYDPARALAQTAADAGDFVARVAGRGGPSVVAFDTELLGHSWPEGVDWLCEVIGACERRGVELVPLGDEADAEAAPEVARVTTWGAGRDLRSWSGPGAGGLAWLQRDAELRAFSGGRPGDRALRELLALQASDWAFLVAAGTAGSYPLERAEGHRAAFEAALADPSMNPALRNLAPWI
jgi:1,4-alpha-glucan branching enzyme